MNRKDTLTEFHRKNIIDTAETLFAENGVAKTTMDDIAKTAEYSKSTVYVYFKSKDEIYDYILLRGMIAMKECIINGLKSDTDFDRRYYCVCHALSDFADRCPLYFDGLLNEINTDPKVLENSPALTQIYTVGEELVCEINAALNDGVKAGILRADIKLPQTVFLLWSGIAGIIRLGKNKSKYFEQETGDSKDQFMQYGFELLLKAIHV